MKINKKLLNVLIVSLVLFSFGMNMIPVQASSHKSTLTLYTDSGFLWSYRYYKVDITTYFQIVPGESYITGATIKLYTTTSGGFPPSLKDFLFEFYSSVNGYWRIYYPMHYDNGCCIIGPSPAPSTSYNYFDGDLSSETQTTNNVKYVWTFEPFEPDNTETGSGTYSWTVPPFD